jgi:hypothetical protein
MKTPDWGAVHRVRLGHVKRLLLDRYGFSLPHDDAGAEDLRILLHVKANACRPEQRERALRNEIELQAPWMPAEEAERIAREITLKPLKVTSAWLGRELGVDSATRERLGIWQIGAVDPDPQGGRERRRQRDRERKRRTRQPRAEYLANVSRASERSAKPWEALGIHRATYYRRQAKAATGFVQKPTIECATRSVRTSTAYHEGDAPGRTGGVSRMDGGVRRRRGS